MSAPIDWGDVRNILIEEYGYSDKGADRAVEKLGRLEEPVASAFVAWWEDRTISGPEVSGYSIERLINKKGMSPPAAILAMNWLHTDHDLALETLDRPRYDTITAHTDDR